MATKFGPPNHFHVLTPLLDSSKGYGCDIYCHFLELLRHFNSACNFANEIHHIYMCLSMGYLSDVSPFEISQTGVGTKEE